MQTNISKYFQPKSQSSGQCRSNAGTAEPQSTRNLKDIIDLETNSPSRRYKFRKVLEGDDGNYLKVKTFPDEGEEIEDMEEGHLPPSNTTPSTPYTPLELQVIKIRKEYPDSLLMVECGYRMRFFGSDAVNAARILGIYAHKDHNFMVASVPTYRAFAHCQRFICAGMKVSDFDFDHRRIRIIIHSFRWL